MNPFLDWFSEECSYAVVSSEECEIKTGYSYSIGSDGRTKTLITILSIETITTHTTILSI